MLELIDVLVKIIRKTINKQMDCFKRELIDVFF